MDKSGNHIQFGDEDTVTMPPGFNVGSDHSFHPQPFGRTVIDNDDDDSNEDATGAP